MKIGTGTTFVTAVDPATFGQVVTLEMVSGDLSSLDQPGTVLISESAATSKGLSIGDPVTIGFSADGEHRFTVGGVYANGSLLGTDYTMSLHDFDEHFTQQLDVNACAKIADGATAEQARAAVAKIAAGTPTDESGSGRLQGVAVQGDRPVPEPGLGAADHGDRDRAVRHREHPQPVGLRTGPGAGAAPRRRHEPPAGQADDPRRVGHHRRAGRGPRRRRRYPVRRRHAAGAVGPGHHDSRSPSDNSSCTSWWRRSPASWRPSCRRAGPRSSTCCRPSPTSSRGRPRASADIMLGTMPTLTMPDGTTTELPEGEPVGSVLDRRSPRGWTVSCGTCPSCPRPTLPSSRSTRPRPDGLHVLRHSAAHVLAQAVCSSSPARIRDRPGRRGRLLLRLRAAGAAVGRRPRGSNRRCGRS